MDHGRACQHCMINQNVFVSFYVSIIYLYTLYLFDLSTALKWKREPSINFKPSRYNISIMVKEHFSWSTNKRIRSISL